MDNRKLLSAAARLLRWAVFLKRGAKAAAALRVFAAALTVMIVAAETIRLFGR